MPKIYSINFGFSRGFKLLKPMELQLEFTVWISKIFLPSFKNTVNSQQHVSLAPLQSHVLTPIKTLTLFYHLTYHGMITTSKLFLNRIKHSVY